MTTIVVEEIESITRSSQAPPGARIATRQPAKKRRVAVGALIVVPLELALVLAWSQ